MKNHIKLFWRNYIKGEYHCDTCPYGWSEYSPGCGDWDAGCVIKGEISDGACRLLPPFRSVIGWIKAKQYSYYLAHEYDNYPAYMEKEERETSKLKESIKQHIFTKWLELYYRDWETDEIKPLNDEKIADLMGDVWEVRSEYESIAHPFVYKSLCQEWRELLAKTVRRIFVEPFVPFILSSGHRRRKAAVKAYSKHTNNQSEEA